jgi:beta-xylosidase
LGLQWQWNHNPVDSAWSLSERRGWLTFHILPADNLKESRNMLTQKTVGYESEATTRIDCTALKDGDHAGLFCMGKQLMGVGVCRRGGRTLFYLEKDGERTLLDACKQKVVCLRVSIDSERNEHQFAVSTDGRNFKKTGEPFPLRMGYWKGSRVGLYSYTTAPTGGKVAFDEFNYIILR